MKLKKLEVNAFAGVSPDAPVVIEFNGFKLVKAVGDMGLGKTSLLNALLVACGHLSKEDKNFINKDSDKIDIDLEFEGKDRKQYHVKVTKSRFVLEYEGVALAEPISKMKELLGVPGVSPMDIKFKPLKDIVKWLASYTNKGAEEFEKQMAKIKDGIKASVRARADANRSAKGLKEYLSSQPMYEKWEDSEKKYTKKVDITALSRRLDEAGKASDKLIQAETKIKQYRDREVTLRTELSDVQKALKMGEKFIDDNKSAKKEYDEIRAQYDSAAHLQAAYQTWQDIKRKKTELDEYETLSQRADAKEKELLEEVKELQAEIIPDVKGVELILEDEMEDGKVIKKEGFYRDGVNAAQMSESEIWAVCMEIWRKNKTKIVVIDNYSSLGSMAVDNLQKLMKDGAQVFVGEMARDKKELEIIYE